MIKNEKAFCNRCKSDLSIKSFYLRSNGKLRSWCIDCEKAYTQTHRAQINENQSKRRKNKNDNLYKYGISNEQYNTILADQNDVCAICKKPESEKRKYLSVDHDHKSGIIRGLLCAKCNRGLGLFKDSRESVIRAISYLASHQIDTDISSKELSWLMQCVESSRRFSTCAKANYYAILVDLNGFQISQGWNGVPSGFPHCIDGGCDRAIENSKSGTSYSNCPAQHAEMGAILRADRDKRFGATIFVNGTPCYDCAKLIVHSGVSRVVYIKDEQYDIEKQLSLWNIANVSYAGVEDEDVY
jgi:deoxycytidylate deaminase